MVGFEVTGPYASAMLMSLGALCVFIWGVLSGAFHGADDAAIRFYETEMESDGTARQASRRVTRRLHAHEMEEYQGGDIQARHGYIPVWLLVVYAVLFALGTLLHLRLLGRARAGTDL